MKTFIVVTIITFLSSFLLNANQKAKVEVTNVELQGEKTLVFSSSFLEILHHFFNSPLGLTNQELTNRGFDFAGNGMPAANSWEAIKPDNCEVIIKKGGYNPNGVFYQYMKNNTGAPCGIKQAINLNEDLEHIFYMYAKTASKSVDVKLVLKKDGNPVFASAFTITSENYKKYTVDIPKMKDANRLELNVIMETKGDVSLDELSITPSNVSTSIRKQYLEAYKLWKPGMIRYPGGWYADTKEAQWQNGIGDVDKRKSPVLYSGESQRIEVGTDEFIAFCKEVGAEAHIVVNLKEGTAEEAANWVEYCNGSVNTTYGALRAKNGHPKPYNVKYWEIGNEQWSEPVWMANRYVTFAKKMLEKDPNIYLFIDGDIWQGFPYLKTVLDISKNYVQNYGWHLAHKIDVNKYPESDNDKIFLSFLGNAGNVEAHINNVDNWLKEHYPDQKIEQSITELWTFYNNWDWYKNSRLFTLESALWTAKINNIAMRNVDKFKMIEHTHNSGIFLTGYDKNNKRIIAPSPTFHAIQLQNNHAGNKMLATNVESGTYNVEKLSGIHAVQNAPYLDVSCSYSKDSIFISMINAHPSEKMDVDLHIKKFEIKSAGIKYVLNSGKILDGNTLNHPNKIEPKQSKYTLTSNITLDQHSLTILALPHRDSNIISTQVNSHLRTMPNPCTDQCTIEFKAPISSTSYIELYTANGIKIFEHLLRIGSTQYSFQTTNYSNGVYFIKVKTFGKSETITFIKAN